MAKTLRVHNLAKDLGVESKDIIEKCRAEGVELKNHMATVSPGLAESIREWFSAGEDVTTVEVAARVDLKKVRKPRAKAAVAQPIANESQVSVADHESEFEAGDSGAEEEESASGVAVLEQDSGDSPPEELVIPHVRPALEPEAPAPAPVVVEAPPPVIAPPPPAPVRIPDVAPVPGFVPTEVRPAATHQPAVAAPRVPMPPKPEAPRKHPEVQRPAGPLHVPKPAELKGPRVVRIEAPEVLAPPRPRPRPAGGGPGGVGAPAARGPAGPGGPNRNPISLPPSPQIAGRKRKTRAEEEEAERRARSRQDTVLQDADSKLKEWRDQDLIERQERLRSATGHGMAARRAAERRRRSPGTGASPAARREAVEIEVPLTVKEFCSAVGVPFAQIFKRLMEHTGRPWTINEQLDAESAELLASDLGLSISVVKARSELETLEDEVAARSRDNPQPRAPVVAILGHVDHGKTSLLDRIRKTDVAAGEAGGITQHIGAYRVDTTDWHVTFLDTPGHAAFTAMRARGADVTDVIVLVVAASDGVQPQTIEAINHAKAAEKEIVVALNKIDLPGVDINKVYGQLAEQDLTPAEWGGKTDVVKTSAVSGEGIDELVAHLSQLSELMDLKADPTVPPVATVLEARMREGHGAVATVLIREGTLKIGQNFVVGPASGRVRQLRNDKGKPLKEAGPGVPVEIAGLDELPRSGDTLWVLDDLNRCKLIASEIHTERRREALQAVQSPRSSMEDLLRDAGIAEVPVLNAILKADVQGSVDALRLELGKIPSDKVRLVIKHAGVGAVNEADVDLARVSDSIILGFNVVADDHAKRHADELGVEIRLYRVIYDIVGDLEKALAGKLAPISQEQRQGTVDVRKVFNVSKLGTIAGCFVRDGLVGRNHRVRLVRDGRVILENAEIGSLKRFKDDAREVKAGLECGIKLVGFDDIKPGDEMQTYTLIQVAQKL